MMPLEEKDSIVAEEGTVVGSGLSAVVGERLANHQYSYICF